MPQTPTFVLRRDLVMAFVDRTPRSFLEVGCGSGDFTVYLGRRGWTGRAIDLSPVAVERTHAALTRSGVSSVETSLTDVLAVRDECFDAVFAFEVLEHIEDDTAALRHMASLIAPGGVIVLSVPAHMGMWSPTDDANGHVRRYEREELERKLAEAGFVDVRVASLGVPLVNMLKPVLDSMSRSRLRSLEGRDAAARTEASGTTQPMGIPDAALRAVFNPVTMWPWLVAQRAFARTDMGRNYVAVARVSN